jgi:metallo-beta-lactamase class B
MQPMRVLALLLLAIALRPQSTSLRPDPPAVCDSCAEWNKPRAPFRLFGNTYYVGVAGLSSVLVASNRGLILLDGALPQSAPLIDANIRALGFRTEDVKLIVNSHAHYDHAGGIAALQRVSRAAVAASPRGAEALRSGLPTPDDPQYDTVHGGFPRVSRVREVRDGEVLRVGDVAITAHFTPGHTPGSTTWTWRSCEGDHCADIVYADSLTSISSVPGFRYSGDATHPSRVEAFRHSIATVAALPCDVMVSVHPGFSDLDGKLARRAEHPDVNPFLDPGACVAYGARAGRALDKRVEEEEGR